MLALDAAARTKGMTKSRLNYRCAAAAHRLFRSDRVMLEIRDT